MIADTPTTAERDAAPGPAATVTTPRASFEAPIAAGPLRLHISGTVRHAADAALLLARCGELIDAVEDWIASPLMWRWLPEAPAASSQSHASSRWSPAEVGDDATVQLDLPWALLKTLAAPSSAALQRLHWSEVPTVLVAARMALDEDELRLLEPGGAIVLPDATGADAAAWLRAEEESAARPGEGMPVRLASGSSARRVAMQPGAPAPAAGAGDRWFEVRLGVPRVLPADRLAGWFEGELGAIHAGASLWRCASETEPARPLATGRLIPWAEGWALALQHLCEMPHCAAAVRGEAAVGESV